MVAPKVGGLVQPVAKQGTKFNPVEGFAASRAGGQRPIPPEYKELVALQELMGGRIQHMARDAARTQDPHLVMNVLRNLGGASGFED